jgi:hypothetical protein
VSAEVLAEVVDGAWETGRGARHEARRADARFLSVGTDEMMRATDGMLTRLGYSPASKHALLVGRH